jgi:DNA-directed RNA polymerase II subunit RPB1
VLYLCAPYSNEYGQALRVKQLVEPTMLLEIVHDSQIVFEVCASHSGRWLLKLSIEKEVILNHQLSCLELYYRLLVVENYEHIELRVANEMNDRLPDIHFHIIYTPPSRASPASTASADTRLRHPMHGLFYLRTLEKLVLSKLAIKGIPGLTDVSIRKAPRIQFAGVDDRLVSPHKVSNSSGPLRLTDEYVLESDGSNLFSTVIHPAIDYTRTVSNDIWDMYYTFGIEVARNSLIHEITSVISDGSYVNPSHIQLLADMMTFSGSLTSVTRHGFNRGDISVLTKASFEETDTVFYNGAINGEVDNMRGVSANIMIGEVVPSGTGVVEILLDEECI